VPRALRSWFGKWKRRSRLTAPDESGAYLDSEFTPPPAKRTPDEQEFIDETQQELLRRHEEKMDEERPSSSDPLNP